MLFRIIFDIEVGNNAEDFEGFIKYIKNRFYYPLMEDLNFLEALSKDDKKNIIDEILFMISDCFLSSLSIDFIDNENILNINSWIINNMNVPDKKIWEASKSDYLSQLKNEFK